MIVAVIPCPRSRLKELYECIEQPEIEPLTKVVVTTEPDPIMANDMLLLDIPRHESDCSIVTTHHLTCTCGAYRKTIGKTVLVHDTSQPPGHINFARWCNLGMAVARELGATEILNINSDIRLNEGTVSRLKFVMRKYDLAMVGVDFFQIVPGDVLVQHTPEPYGFHTNRVSHACFMTPAEQDLRMDEAYTWHYEADDFEYQCRTLKGVGIVGKTNGYQPPDTSLTKERKPLAAAGRERFLERWGVLPW